MNVGKVTICIVVQELYRVVQGYIVNTVYRVHARVEIHTKIWVDLEC